MTRDRVIGANGGVPWHVPADLARFKQLTYGQVVVMGRKTYESLPQKNRPLPGRRNIVLSRRQSGKNDDVECCNLAGLKRMLAEDKSGRVWWIIGGEEVFRATMELWDEVHVTVVEGEYQGDTYFPNFEEGFTCSETTKSEACEFRIYQRKQGH